MSREAPVVDALIGICVHDPDAFVEPPSVVRNWAAQALARQIEDAVLSPEAKTAFLITQGALSFEESEKAAAGDLTDQMHEFMAGSGLDPAAYDLRSFTEELRTNLKILCMAAVRKEVPQVAPDEAKSVEATVSHVQVRKQRITPLIEAVQKQNVDAVRERIEAGDNIEATDSYGQTALHWATKDKSVEIVEILLDAGADPNAKDQDGDTPLKNAQKNANPAIAEALAQLEGRLATGSPTAGFQLMESDVEEMRERVADEASSLAGAAPGQLEGKTGTRKGVVQEEPVAETGSSVAGLQLSDSDVEALETEKARLKAEIAAEVAKSKKEGCRGKLWQAVFWIGVLMLGTSCLLVGLPLLDRNSVVKPDYMVCTGVTIGVAILLTFASSRLMKPNVDKLIEALGYKDASVRQSAAEALGEIGDAQAVEPLSVALKDDDMSVRRDAAEALGKIGDARALEPLCAALKDDRGGLRREAASALGKIGDARALEPLSVALKDLDMSVRREAAEALGKIGDARAVEPLLSVALKDDDMSVRREAAEALPRFGVRLSEGACDICNSPGMGIMIDAQQMWKAVWVRGFNPFESALLRNYAALQGLGAEEAYGVWKNDVTQFTTDWRICPNCMSMLKPYL